jgi:hypothetical protein
VRVDGVQWSGGEWATSYAGVPGVCGGVHVEVGYSTFYTVVLWFCGCFTKLKLLRLVHQVLYQVPTTITRDKFHFGAFRISLNFNDRL